MTKLIKKEELTKFDKERKELIYYLNMDREGTASLTGLWRYAGSPKNMNPNDWLRTEQGVRFIESVCKIQNTVKNRIIKSKRGKGGGTYGVNQIVLEYAKYLDTDLSVLVNDVFFERIEEEKNPDLIIDRGIDTYKRRGKSDEWITKRLKGKLKRRLFTDCLQTHGVKGNGYAECTNNTYNPLSNGNAFAIKKQKGLSKTASLRDNMSEFELSAIEFSETLSAQTIEKENLYGNDQCALACRRASTIIAKILQEHNKPLF